MARPSPAPEASPNETAPEGSDDRQAADVKKRRSFWRELPVLIVVAFAVALLIKTFLLQAFYIPSPSMEPTLVFGDRVIVEKLSGWFGDPGRGEIVVFERELPSGGALPPDEPFWTDIVNALKGLFGFPTGDTQDFIKRVIAVGGDTVEGREGRVYLNGEPLEEPYLAEGTQTGNFAPVTIPEGQIFVMGDNRNNSDDSRSFGPIETDSIIGRAVLQIWPIGDLGAV